MKRVNRKADPSVMGGAGARMQMALQQNVIGQDEAVKAVVRMYQRHVAGLSAPDCPIGSALLLGPTGTGKTFLAEQVCGVLLGSDKKPLKINCAEFDKEHESARLKGAPPGYIGHKESKPLLNQKMLDAQHTAKTKISVVLFDEIEKASESVWNLLLGILDKGEMVDGANNRVDFSRSFIFLTSNLGAREMQGALNPMGFNTPASRTDGQLNSIAAGAARKRFSPEFFNRIDEIVTFRPLGSEELNRILVNQLKDLQSNLIRAHGTKSFLFSLSDSAKQRIIETGTDARYGARHLKRTLHKLVTCPLAGMFDSGEIESNSLVCGDYEPGADGLSWKIKYEDLDMINMVAMGKLIHSRGVFVPTKAQIAKMKEQMAA